MIDYRFQYVRNRNEKIVPLHHQQENNLNTFLIIIFLIGYAAIAFENGLRINKSAIALLTGVMCWMAYMFTSSQPSTEVVEKLIIHLGDISGILFFLLAAMTIVELIDAHDGFQIVTSIITTRKKIALLWLISFITFFLSAILDNLTTAIVMVSLLKKLIDDDEDRLLFAGMVVIAANAGGAWSPIGDVTTTMLWIGGQVTALNIMKELFLPSVVCLLAPLLFLSLKLKGTFNAIKLKTDFVTSTFERNLIFVFGVCALIMVPVFKSITHLPPFMGILFSLALLWILTELIHRKKKTEDKDAFSVSRAMQRIDTPSILFFLGILLAVSALQSASVLTQVANYLQQHISNINVMVLLIGLLSAIVDNVPLVAASMGMYPLATFPSDHYLWEFLAYCAGTGGSILIIGSAAGVAAMGIEKISFGWYVKRISLLALVGYFAGAFVYMLMER